MTILPTLLLGVALRKMRISDMTSHAIVWSPIPEWTANSAASRCKFPAWLG
jgi:hypothetical protein